MGRRRECATTWPAAGAVARRPRPRLGRRVHGSGSVRRPDVPRLARRHRATVGNSRRCRCSAAFLVLRSVSDRSWRWHRFRPAGSVPFPSRVGRRRVGRSGQAPIDEDRASRPATASKIDRMLHPAPRATAPTGRARSRSVPCAMFAGGSPALATEWGSARPTSACLPGAIVGPRLPAACECRRHRWRGCRRCDGSGRIVSANRPGPPRRRSCRCHRVRAGRRWCGFRTVVPESTDRARARCI